MKRVIYGAVFLVLLFTEALIALYVHDDFIRPYVGDMLAVIVVYCLVRMIMPEKCRVLPLYIFLFAAGIEFMQYFDLVGRLGLESNRALRILLGSVFDLKDILCYALGCAMLAGYEVFRYNYGAERRPYEYTDFWDKQEF